MKNDPFMLELFLKEAREHCAALGRVRDGAADAAAGASSANSLKGAARMLGFSAYAAVCEKVEDFLLSAEGARKFNSAFSFAVDALSKAAARGVADVEECIDSSKPLFDEILKSDFGASDVPSGGAPKPETASADRLPPIDESMKTIFSEEVGNQLSSISSALVELEDDFSNPQKLERLMRASHSLKGAARVVGLGDIVDFTHEMENCFSAAQNSKIRINSDSLDVFLDCADFIARLRDDNFESMNRPRFAELFAQLREIEAGGTPKRAPRKSSEEQPSGGGARRDAYVKVSPESLSSLMELAAEILIENRRVELYRESAAAMKSLQEQIVRQLENAMNSLEGTRGSDAAMARLEQLRKSMRSLVDTARTQAVALGEYSRRNVALSGRLYAEVLASRMRPLSDGLTAFPRLVRDLAKESGKKISLEIHGKDVPVDRDVLENLEAPLTHLLRNACDHGIEAPEIRAAAGKPQTGKIVLSAWHSGGFLMLRIEDDGAGLDESKIRAKILERKLVAPEILENMPADELFEFLFLPNFSTKDDITQLSGRGVGLDVVQSMMREVDGSISVSTVAGRGAMFTMKLPVTRSVVKALTVEIAGEPYAFPLARVYRTLRLAPSEIENAADGCFFNLDGRRVRLFSGAEVLGFGRQAQRTGGEVYAVASANKGNVYAFGVDGLPNEVELVVRPLSAGIGKIPCISAASLDENGLPVLIIDVDDLMAYAGKISARASDLAESANSETSGSRRKILVVDDSATVRQTQRKILEGAGYAVDTAVDGMDGWNTFRLSDYDMVVSDVDMPRMTGFELVEKIRSVNASIPVVIVSYKDRSEDRAKGAAAGANAYLTKNSFQDDSFLKTVCTLLD